MQILVQLCMLLTLNGIKSDLFAWKEELKILQMGVILIYVVRT